MYFSCYFKTKGLQECWNLEVIWDAELPICVKKKIEKWKNQLNDLKDIVMSRCIVNDPENAQNLNLQFFCDASKVAYAVRIFLRSESENSSSYQLIQVRYRVFLLKTITIPRLELLACTID